MTLRTPPFRCPRAALGTLLIGLIGGLSVSPAARAETKARTELTLGVLFDDNAALGRRGLFGAEPVVDVTSVLQGTGQVETGLGKGVSFTFTGKLRSEEARWRSFLRNTEVSAKPGLEIAFKEHYALRPELSFKVKRELEAQWDFVEVAPSLEFTAHTTFGLIIDAGYSFTATLYDSKELTNTYVNVDRLSHLAKLQAKIWQTQYLRWKLHAEVEHQSFADNIGPRLGKIAFLPLEEYTNPDAVFTAKRRADLFVRGEGELLFVPAKFLAVAVGYKVDSAWSDIHPFTNVSHGPRLALGFAYGRHEAYAEARFTMYDFRDFQFDVRFADTRKDIRLEGYAAYAITLGKSWKLGLKASFQRNDSNDWKHFDPRLTRSYSLYQGTRVEGNVSYTWETRSGTPAPEKPDEIPGTIQARR